MKKILLLGVVTVMGTMMTVTRSVAADLITVDDTKLQTMISDRSPVDV